MIYGKFDATGKPTGFYLPEIHGDNIPAEAVEISEDDYEKYIQEQGRWVRNASGIAVPTDQPTQDEILIKLTVDVQSHLDKTAQQRGYDGILSLCSYAASTNTTFADEGRAGVAWRDGVWVKCSQIKADVLAGKRATPTEAELIAELPTFVWP